jgi:Ser/Thr protein kinase RdoA (MazF antagonist)
VVEMMADAGPPTALAHDAAVPQRDLLLDAAWMREWFSTHMAAPPAAAIGCRVLRARYRPGDSLRVVFEVSVANGTVLAVARTHGPEARIDAASRSSGGGGLLPARFHDERLRARFWTVPFDPRMPALPELLAVPEGFDTPLGARWRSSRLAGYSPHKQATVACLDDRERPFAYAKVYGAGEDSVGAFHVHRAAREAAAGDHALSVPDALAQDVERRVVYLEAMPGRRIADLPSHSLPYALRALGRAAASLHGCGLPVAVLPNTPGLSEPQIDAASRLIARARPDVSGEVGALVRELRLSRPDGDTPVPLHGDLHLKNALIDGGQACLIDLDQMTAGPPVVDLASLIASLIADGLTGRVPMTTMRACVRSLADGYRSVRQYPDARTVAWHVGAALLVQRGARAVSRVRRESLARLPDIIAVARQVTRTKDVLV